MKPPVHSSSYLISLLTYDPWKDQRAPALFTVKAGRIINWKAIQHTSKMISKHLQATALHLIDSLTATENCALDPPSISSGCADAWPPSDAPAGQQLTPAEVNGE
eukprot:1160392-Pelagomonas_calceolata.AAC.6